MARSTKAQDLALPPAQAAPPRDHVVQFYDETASLVQSAGAYLAGGLLRGCPAIVIAEERRLPLFQRQLESMGVDVPSALASRRLILLDARETLSRFMAEGLPDERSFREVLGTLVAGTTEIWHPARLHAYGDMVDLLWADGNSTAALALEELWNDLAHRHGFALFCAYSANHFKRDEQRAAFHAVCHQHGQILPIDGAPAMAS